MRSVIGATLLSVVWASVSWAQAGPPAYLDDRSDAAALLKSFYNAINRREFGRAWDYFGEKKPSKDFETFAKGYEQTESVRLVTGEPGVEGAAGTTYFSVPVSFAAFSKDGSEQVFAGCYTVRLADPQLQEPPFKGMVIEGAELAPSEQPFEEKLPEKCGDGPAPEPKDAVLEQARKAFVALHAGQCSSIAGDGTTGAPESYTIGYRGADSSESAEEQEARLFRFNCGAGAYNESHVYFLHENVRGLRELQFATPELDIRYENDDSEGKVESLNVIGYRTEAEITNSFYDEGSQTIASHAKWRGIGDASSSGTWIFREGTFTLVKFDVDASYDGEINPETVLDFHTGP